MTKIDIFITTYSYLIEILQLEVYFVSAFCHKHSFILCTVLSDASVIYLFFSNPSIVVKTIQAAHLWLRPVAVTINSGLIPEDYLLYLQIFLYSWKIFKWVTFLEKYRKLMAKITSNPWEWRGRTHLNSSDPQIVFMLIK